MNRCWSIAAAALACAALVAPPRVDIEPAVATVLSRDLRFSPGDLSDLERGKLVKHGLDAKAPGEIAVVGAVRVAAAKAALLDRIRDIANFKRGSDVVQIGRFSDPPSLDDLAALTVDKNDFDVTTCRVHDCDVRLPADTIRRFQREVDRKAPDVQQQTAALFKHVLLEHVNAYLSGGATRIVQYDDGPQPIRPIDEFEAILKSAPSVGALVPGLPDHLAHFPSDRLADAQDFLYWSKEKFGVAPFITVTHITIACPSAPICVASSKDVYSSRYFDASLALTIATDSMADAKAFYLVYANRSRANALKGAFAGIRRTLVQRRARSSLEDNLRAIKTRLEHGR